MMSRDGKKTKLTPYGMCLEFIQMHNMVPVLEFLKAKHHSIVFMIDSDYENVKQRMKQRGTPGDITKSNFEQYKMYQ
jgi:deoxyadenosine/deoxycytidine kinase